MILTVSELIKFKFDGTDTLTASQNIIEPETDAGNDRNEDIQEGVGNIQSNVRAKEGQEPIGASGANTDAKQQQERDSPDSN
jgi:hypothetical protein